MNDECTTKDVACAAGVTTRTIARWVQRGLLAPPRVFYGGRRGKRSTGPATAPEQAAQVRHALDQGAEVAS